MICIKCGYDNPPTANACAKCRTPLPKMPAGYEAPRPVLTERLQKFIDAAENLKNGTWTLDDFKSFLDNMAQVLGEKAAEIRATEIPPEMFDDFSQELAVGLEGINLYEQGMAEMYHIFRDGDANHLDVALDLMEQGNEKINEAMRINRENRQKMEELYSPDVGPSS